MFVDPLRIFDVSLPPNWAYDPRTSSLTRLVFFDWEAPLEKRIFVCVFPHLALAPAGVSDLEWEDAIRATLPPEITRCERRSGHAANGHRALVAEFPGSERYRGRRRLAWVRGPRLVTVVEQDGVPVGSALLTAEIHETLRTLKVYANTSIPEYHQKSDYRAAFDAARHARELGDAKAAILAFADAKEIAIGTWLHSLVTKAQPDVQAAISAATALLAGATLPGPLQALHDATTTLYRCRNSSAQSPGTPGLELIDSRIGQALELHGRLSKRATPIDCGAACQVRAGLFGEVVSQLSDTSYSGEESAQEREAARMLTGRFAVYAYENAKTAMALQRVEASLHYDDLIPQAKDLLGAQGVLDELSWQEQLQRREIDVLVTLACAGRAMASVGIGGVDISVPGFRRDAVRAGRLLVTRAPSTSHRTLHVPLLLGLVDALLERGDELSLREAYGCLGEASLLIADLGDPADLRLHVAVRAALVHCADRDAVKGVSVAEHAISLARVAGNAEAEGVARRCRSELLNHVGLHQEALNEARCALDIHADRKGAARERLAMALYHTGETSKATQEMCAALALADVPSPLNESVERYLSSASVILQPQDPAASLGATEAAELVMQVRRSAHGGTEERIAYDDAAHHRVLAATLVQRRLQTGDVPGALATADGHRARSLAEAAGILQTMSTPADVSSPPSAGASLMDHIAFVTRTARNALGKWGVAPPVASDALLAAAAEHARTIVLIHPADDQLLVFVLKAGNPPAVHSVVANSVRDTLALTETLRRRLSIALATRAARGELPPQSLEDTVAEFADDYDGVAQPDGALDDVCRRLFNALFSTADNLMEPQEPIVVVPYRELSVIPLSLLMAPDGRRFADHHAVSVLPSIASLTTLVRPQAAQPHAVVVGDPVVPASLGLARLNGAAKEAERVSELLAAAGMKTVPLLGPEATEAKFRTAVAGARVVHLACHAALREPASASPLFLSPSEHDNGLLLPEEISDLQLDAALVVLSACESGLGRATADGVLGLGRAFLRAGARAILLSLWRVNDDATAYLMRQFYEGLVGTGAGLKGKRLDVAAAVQRAQVATRDNISNDASIWGPWLLVGDGGWRLG